MVKIRVLLACEASTADSKTSVRNVKRFQVLPNGPIYKIPTEFQLINFHPELTKIPTIARGLQQLTKRGAVRNLNVTLDEETTLIYFDEEENPQFKDMYLEEYVAPTTPIPSVPAPAGPISIEKKAPRSIAKDFVLEKFTGKSQNAASWIAQFESECIRCELTTDAYAEMLRLFLEGQLTTDWFHITLKDYGLALRWGEWKEKFLEDFSNKGWSDVVYAFNYSYSKGSLAEYALKKLRLLLECDPSLKPISRINLIVTGLPDRVRNRLDRQELESTSDLVSALKSLEYLAAYAYKSSKPLSRTSEPAPKNPEKPEKFCQGCLKSGRIYRNHTDVNCGFNPINKGKRSENPNTAKPVKVANNTQLEEVINDNIPEPKN